jgi:hypothetical protein
LFLSIITCLCYQSLTLTRLFLFLYVTSGVIPQALLQRYTFWQNEDDSLTGVQTAKAKARSNALSRLHVTLMDSGLSTRIVRIPLVPRDETPEEREAAETLRLKRASEGLDNNDGDDATSADLLVEDNENRLVLLDVMAPQGRLCGCSGDVQLCSLLCCSLSSASALVTFICACVL